MSLKRSGRKIRGIKGGKERGYYSHYHTNKLNIFVTIFTTGRTCTTQAQAQAQDLHPGPAPAGYTCINIH